MPSSAELILRNATAALAEGRLADAERLATQALQVEPHNREAQLLLGVALARSGKDEAARPCLASVLESDHNRLEALFWLSIVHRRHREFPQAISYAERAVNLRPQDPHMLNNLGLCYLERGSPEQAADLFRRAAAIRGDLAPIHHNLGTALYQLGRDLAAAEEFDRALAINPQDVASLLNLGQTMISMTNPGAAAQCAQKALRLVPRAAPAHLLMANALAEDGKTAEAESHLRSAMKFNPEDAQVHALLGMRLQSSGHFADANEHLRRSLELEPRQGFAYFAYVHNNKITEDDRPMVDRMEELVRDGGLPPREMAFLEYGLGRAYEALKDYESAMRHFDEANRLSRRIKFGDAAFDREAYATTYDWLIRKFDRDFMASNAGKGNPSELPILIVGMMRSGTTLCEQILSSHPMVAAGGEQRFWPQNRHALFGADGSKFNLNALIPIAGKYIERLRSIDRQASRVTDKMPVNFELVGPLHLGLPDARIIHMRRHPVDICVSIYATPNRVPIEYAYDRANIVFAYRQYERLMNHWRSVMPKDRFLEIRYEDLVADRKAQVRMMLDFVGLKWDDAVMRHEKSERSVLTPSLWQVRQPIYNTSVERWRRYEPWLREFAALL